jgi:hypothetical protein
VILQWASYYDAADQVGLSRIWGGIHPPADDLSGRRVGAEAGNSAWALAQKFFDGSVANTAIHVTNRRLEGGNVEVRFNTIRGMHYRMHSSPSVNGPYSDGGSSAEVAFESHIVTTNTAADAQRFIRVSSSLTP